MLSTKDTRPRTGDHTTTEAHGVYTATLQDDARTGGDILVEVMRAAGCEVAFGVISIHNMPLVEAVDRELRFVPVRHEAAAVNAADGYARASGEIGVAITSTGTGAGNAAGSMLEALTAQSRVLHITGNIDSDLLGEHSGAYHEVPRQLEMLGAVSGHALRIETARQPRAVLSEAVRLVRTAPHLPVSVDWPIDLQYTADPSAQNVVRERSDKLRAPRGRDLDRAIQLMGEARRPLIWAGGGAREVGPALTALAETWGAGVLTGTNGRGSVPEDHPLCVGNFGGDESVAALVADADCLLTIGSHLRAHETRSGDAPLPTTHVQVDLDADAFGRNAPTTVGVLADARVAVPALLTGLAHCSPDREWVERVTDGREAARHTHRQDIGAYAEICDSMRARLPRRSPVVRDVTIPGSSWGNRLLAIHDPSDNVYAAGGGIGQGLAMAIGAAVARPEEPVLAMVGDGGLAVHLGELGVLAAEQPHLVLVVFTDGGYGVLRNLQEARGDRPRAVDLATPEFADLAAAYRIPHARVGDPAGLDRALEQALGRPGPSMIEVDVPSLRPTPEPLVPPVEVPRRGE